MFELGKILVTQGINIALEDGEITTKELQYIIFRHLNNVDDNKYCEDRKANQQAINEGNGRVLTVHNIKHSTGRTEKIYCITEGLGNPEYLHTTILYAEEY